LNGWVSEETEDVLARLHHQAWDVLLILIALHVAAILFYYLVKRSDLLRPMLTGRAELPEGAAAPRIAGLPLAIALAAAAAVLVWALVAYGPSMAGSG
jgi:hypothetical protein